MRLFSEKVVPTFTSSNLNILTVEDFQEIFFDVFEFEINGKKFIAEKVSKYKGLPVVDVPLVLEGKEFTAQFVLQRGKFEVLFNRDNSTFVGEIVEERVEPVIEYADRETEVEEIIFEKKEDILAEISQARQSAEKYVEKLRHQKNNETAQYFDEKKKALDNEINESKEGLLDEFLSLVESVKGEFFEFNEKEREKLSTFIESSISELADQLVESIEEKQDIAERRFNEQLNELANIKVDVPNIVIEKSNGKQEVNLKGIKSELEKIIGTRFSNELQALKRLIEMSSGGGSVAKQFAAGGTMEGTLNVTGQYLSAGVDLLTIFLTGAISSPQVGDSLMFSETGWVNQPSTQTTILTSAGTTIWNIPNGVKSLDVICIGAGGGGGGGARLGTGGSSFMYGGTGGGGGSLARYSFVFTPQTRRAATIIVGSGGSGGIGSNGSPGSPGNSTSFALSGSFTSITAYGGTGGNGGSTSSGTVGGNGGIGMFTGGGGQGWLAGGFPALPATIPVAIAGAGGGGVGGLASTSGSTTGGQSGSTPLCFVDSFGSLQLSPGAGGSGGSGRSTSNGVDGLSGRGYGGGGGGGGSTFTGTQGGTGGNGASGCVIIICHF